MFSHLDSNHLCQITASQIQEILVLNGVIIQQHQSYGNRWLTVAQVPDNADLILRLDTAKNQEVERRLKEQEIVEFTAMTTVMGISIFNRYLFVPLIDRGELWGRICLLGTQQTICSPQDLAWVQALGQQLVAAVGVMNKSAVAAVANGSSKAEAVTIPSDPLDTVASLIEQVANLESECQRKDVFINNVSHDLRAPLMNISMAAKMLRISLEQDPVIASLLVDHRAQRYLQLLESECQREVELINNVLDLQRLELAIEDRKNLEAIDVSDLIAEIAPTFIERTKNRQQKLTVNITKDLPTLITDRTYLTKIITEILNNACKYTPPDGNIDLTIDLQPNPDRLVTTIGNQAEISSNHLHRIFEQFYRIPGSDRAGQGGTGLGLSLVKKFVESLQGEIAVTSDRGWTEFTISLPLARNSSESKK
jgi:signal transduction histidine kinase